MVLRRQARTAYPIPSLPVASPRPYPPASTRGLLWKLVICAHASEVRSWAMLAPVQTPTKPSPKQHTIETWIGAKRHYVQGKAHLPEIASKYGIALGTLKERCCKEKWRTLRAQYVERATEAILPPVPVPQRLVPLPDNSPVSAEVATLKEQIERIDGMIAHSACVADLDKLASAKSKLLEQWRVLSGIPKPGSRRPAREDLRPRRGLVAAPEVAAHGARLDAQRRRVLGPARPGRCAGEGQLRQCGPAYLRRLCRHGGRDGLGIMGHDGQAGIADIQRRGRAAHAR